MLRATLRKFGGYLVSLAEPAPATDGGSRRIPGAASSGRFEARARDLVETRRLRSGKIVAGSIQILRMDDFKSGLEAAPDLVHPIARRTIAKHLDDADSFEMQGDETFILCFQTPNRSEAELKTRAIVAEIKERLAEERADAGLKIEHAIVEIDCAELDADSGPIVNAIAQALRNIRDEAAAAARTWRDFLVQRASTRFGPIWTPRTRTVFFYRALLDEETGNNAMRRLTAIAAAEDVKQALFDLDCLILGQAIRALHNLLSGSGTAQILIPITCGTLMERAMREKYLTLCRDIPPPYRKCILFQLHGVPSGVPSARLAELALRLKTHCRGIFLEFPLKGIRVQELSALGIHGISLDARSLPARSSDAIQQLTCVVSAAKAAGLEVFVQNAATIGVINAVVNAAVNHVDGSAVALPVAELKSTYPWNPRFAA